MVRTVHLVRHGEPEAGYTKRFLGRLNPGLSENGLRQAEKLVPRLRPLAPEICLTSPLARAAETAAILADGLGVKAEAWDLLKEIDFGKLEGLTFDEARASFPGMTDSWQALSGDFAFPDGEDFPAFERRAGEIAATLGTWPGKSLLVVAHGGILRGVLCRLLGVACNGPLRFRLAYASLASVEIHDGGTAVLTGFNIGREPLA
ncbi:MAG: histidine phosphatase family protein [Planctomycetota bacterium]|jgi:alpha-ribazole phosphatase|nr:histidine phosphatase family protein [Planctomycetota bacterium]